jgi:replication fork protection complex subunit Tof1/Swi1
LAVELLVQLTWPVEKDPERERSQISYEAALKYAQIINKNSILFHPQYDILRPIIRIALPSMAIPRKERPDRDDHIISLVISLLRNLAEISARGLMAAGVEQDTVEHSREDTILSFEKSDVLALLSALASGATDEYEKVDCLILEILYHLLKGVSPNDIFAVEHNAVF